MSDVELQRENAALREQLSDAKQALEAMARGEVDAVAAADAGMPVLLRAAQEELRSSRALLRAVFDGSIDALLLVDDRGTYVDANVAAAALFGVPREKLLGANARDHAPHGFDVGVRLHALLESGRLKEQLPLTRADGTLRVLELSAVANVAPGLHLLTLHDVSERVAAEDALRRSEVRFRAMIEKGHDGIALFRQDARPIYQSPAVERLLGFPLDEARIDLVDRRDHPKVEGALAMLLASPGALAAVECRVRRRDGSRSWVEIVATNWLEDPDIGAIVVNFRDISERKSFEEEREGFFGLTLDLLCIAGRDGRFRRLNPAWEATLGWPLEELCARPWMEFVHPEDRAVTAMHAAELAEGRVVRFENRYRCMDGSYRWLQWAAIPTSTGLVYACAHDVTTERATAERHRLLFAASPVPMLLVDASTLHVLDTNDACVHAYGYSREELLSRTLYDLVTEEQHDVLQSSLERRNERAETIVVADRQHRTKSGERRHVQVTRHRLNLNGRDAILEVIIDVTEGRRLEEERARYVERLRMLELSVSRLNDVVLITKATPLAAPGPEIVYANGAFERMTGYTPEEALGKSPRMLQGRDTDPAALARMRAAIERAEPVREEIINYTKAGVPYWVEIDIAPVRDDQGVLTHFIAVERDRTEQHRTREALRLSEERLRQAQKMEAVGNLAGGIAHDFNNLLSIILSYSSLRSDELPPGDPLRKDLEEIYRAGLRASDMTRQLLAFSRKQMLQPTAVDVSAAVLVLENMLRRLIGEDIELAIHAPVGAGMAFVDPTQLEQVILNLVVNARDAMPDGGHITIETASVELDEGYASLNPGVKPGPYVRLTVSDTGAGMDRATQERIFDPFFTTKEQGKGTGLGLSTVYGIVQQSGGSISLRSAPGAGTTFKIHLPRTDRAEDMAINPAPAGESLRGSETVLLVEDEDPVRQVVRSILRKNGYHVLEAQNAGEALLVCEQFDATIHLLLTDVVMPRVSGKQLADRLAALRPDMRILFMSGYTENTITHHGVLDEGVAFLPKPVVPHALLKKLRQVLDRS